MTVFLSYAHQDAELADALRAELARLAGPVWLDKSLVGGQRWWAEILRQISGCHLFVLLVSRHSMASDACLAEWGYASALDRPFLPVRTDHTDWTTAPAEMRQTQLIDFRPGDAACIEALAQAVENADMSVPLPEVIPDPPPVPQSYRDRFAKLFAPTLVLDDQVDYFGRLTFDLGGPNQSEALRLLQQLHDRTDLSWTVRANIETILAEHPLRQEPPGPTGSTPGRQDERSTGPEAAGRTEPEPEPGTSVSDGGAARRSTGARAGRGRPGRRRRARAIALVAITLVAVGVVVCFHSPVLGGIAVVAGVGLLVLARRAPEPPEPPEEPVPAHAEPPGPESPGPAARDEESRQVWHSAGGRSAPAPGGLPAVELGVAWWNRADRPPANRWVPAPPEPAEPTAAPAAGAPEGTPLPAGSGTAWWTQHGSGLPDVPVPDEGAGSVLQP